MHPDPRRRLEIEHGLERVRERITKACEDAGREPAEITLIVITKYFPAEDVVALHQLGVRDIGENKDQEAGAKIRAVREHLTEAGAPDLTLHFVGQLQSNKAGHVAAYADVIHSVDRPKLVTALSKGAEAAGRTVDVLIQVSLDGETGRGGALPEAAEALAEAIEAQPRLRLRGVMAVAPLGADADESFARLSEVAGGLRDRHPQATWVSAGMSGDLEAAIRHGATHLRVGTAILGSRPSLL
ncbi:MAG TPA: YggS family pyridoxal phosphate-dependent enzyme [Dermatophilaceae bacterium]|nr:YggS family pyridoxal phosphate-dependent enzyme [Dermatophilaceae bacterium]